MAKLQMFQIDESLDPDIEENYHQLSLVKSKGKTALFVDDETGFQVEFTGKDFKYEDGALVSGKLEELHFLGSEGDTFAKITDLKLVADNIPADFTVNDLLFEVLKGNDVHNGTSGDDVLNGEDGKDVINGKRGDDTIHAGAGKDDMTGGAGNDTFEFFGISGNDVIRDFNVGDDENFDTLFLIGPTFDEFQKAGKHDTLAVFSDGSTVLLEGVKFSESENIHVSVIV